MLALIPDGNQPKMLSVDGRHVYTDGMSYWPSVTALIERLNPYHGPEHDASDPNGPAQVGTRAHEAMAKLLRTGLDFSEPGSPEERHVHALRGHAKRISRVFAIERRMASPLLGLGGTVDAVGIIDGRLSVIDWKTKSAEPTDEILAYHHLQAAAYAHMWHELTGDMPAQTSVIWSDGERAEATHWEADIGLKRLFSDEVIQAIAAVRMDMRAVA